MADTKISALTAATVLGDTDELVLAVAGANKKITGANLKASMPAPAGGAWALLSTTTVTGTAAQLDVSSISGTYNDLLLVAALRGNVGGGVDQAELRFNNDSAANYGFQMANATGGAAETTAGSARTEIDLNTIPVNGATAGFFSFFEVLVPWYASTTFRKAAIYQGGALTGTGTGNFKTINGVGMWNSTAAITRVTLFMLSAPNTFVVGSSLRIYGRL